MQADVVNLACDQFLHLQENRGVPLELALYQVHVLDVGLDGCPSYVLAEHLAVVEQSHYLRVFESHSLLLSLKFRDVCERFIDLPLLVLNILVAERLLHRQNRFENVDSANRILQWKVVLGRVNSLGAGSMLVALSNPLFIEV
jgi:hypothetical protein